MSVQSRLAIATRGYRGGFQGGGVSQTIYIDQGISAAVDYQSITVGVEQVQAIGVEYGPIEVQVDIEGCS